MMEKNTKGRCPMFLYDPYALKLDGLLDAFDALAADADSEDLEELNAEFDDALMMLEEIDFDADDWREAFADALEELNSLRETYAKQPGAGALAAKLGDLIEAARRESGV